MNVKTFVDTLLTALAGFDAIQDVTTNSEGPTVNGRARLSPALFLSFYYNEATGTIAFALIEAGERIWGVDYDNIRGWHLHPITGPQQHLALLPQTIPEIINRLKQVLKHRVSVDPIFEE